jgi:hypothetical protein
MTSVRTVALIAPALAAVVLAGAMLLVRPDAGSPARAPVVAPSPAQPAEPPGGAFGDSSATTGAASGGVTTGTAADSSTAGADALQAARTTALYCHLLEERQFARAGELCAGRGLWSRRRLGGVSRFHFRSASVYAAPDARTLVLKARVRVHAGRGRPLPDGLAVLYFTLGRAGSAVGGWLITAVSTSPQPSGKGSL